MFRLLVIADIHYASDRAEAAAAPPERRCVLGCELLRRAIEDANRRGWFDAIALMGDLINDSAQPNAADDIVDLRAAIEEAAPDVPVLAVGGNHDNDDGLVVRAFGKQRGAVELGGYRFVAFSDAYAEGKYGTRRESDRRLLRELAERPGGPIVVLQHSPMNPPIDSDYPFMLTNGPAVLADYARAGVLLSISGHYHPGQEINLAGGVHYYTAPVLCERPFHYAIVTLDGRQVRVERRRLALDAEERIVDGHAHTQFAYCGRNISAEAVIDRSREMGVSGVVLTEHAPQLYCRADDFWEARHVFEPRTWRGGEHSRMAEFRRAVGPLRGESVRVGLEVELDLDGHLTLHEEDRRWVDRIVGAVHWLPDKAELRTIDQLAAMLMRTNERILAAGVDVLAHPWRLPRWKSLRVPAREFAPLARMLAETGTAAEVNFHGNRPDVAFFAECIERGVKLAIGSDAHEMWEVGSFQPHLALVREAAGTDRIDELLLD